VVTSAVFNDSASVTENMARLNEALAKAKGAAPG